MKLFEIIDGFPISEKSKEIYKNHLKILNNNVEPEKRTFLNSTKKIINKLTEMSVISQINYLSSIMVVLDKKSKAYKQYFDLKGELMSKRMEDLQTNVKERSYNNNIKNLQYKLIHDILKFLPRRLMDLYLLRFMDDKPMNPNYNYLAKKDGKYILVFNNYKTSGIYGPQIFDFPPEVIKTLEEYLKQPEVKKSKAFVFGRIKDGELQPYESINGFGQMFKRETGLTFNDMRHLYAKLHCKGLTDNIDDHLQKLGHSYQTNIYYQKT